MRSLAALAVLALLAPVSAPAQVRDYEVRYGEPVDVSLSDIVQNSASYQGRAVRTRGRLEVGSAARTYVMRDSFAGAARVVPFPEIAGEFESTGLRMLGQDVEITGVVFEISVQSSMVSATEPRVGIQFWSFQGPPEKESPNAIAAAGEMKLEALVNNPGRRDGQLVRVVGKFRGRNLYGDLPVRSQRGRSDWVIKDDAFAVWVTDHKPKGKGFALDSSLKRDTGKWIEVVGRPLTRNGITYIKAVRIALTSPPSETADVKPPPPPPERPKVPPVIVFALPLDGDGEVPADGRFVVQFSKDMDEQTFDGRVRLRYSGPVRPGDRPFDGMRLSYDQGRRALTVDPGTMLEPGRQVELLLLPGILDVEGLGLSARVSHPPEGVVDILRYMVGG